MTGKCRIESPESSKDDRFTLLFMDRSALGDSYSNNRRTLYHLTHDSSCERIRKASRMQQDLAGHRSKKAIE
ncbi:hypothetical protein BABINDRAFT_159381 [Babjeviella inositovora NRRL Y-12698]|uniref:Uncharacterized protein n=1 Tax=Babjeviella inositovora NRRL Y-12698 TaxID=984486 RepID=A0A1E3R0H2_9ASCO|nr:uncharacterized protein BABINDRAFT_159381 [Babjeviella inositovora NRRL Y-12698]ODQ82887.1 hypothetical protein BABINDRAFT_159381 [Babjeviella inositovora NRRL Y-12698]